MATIKAILRKKKNSKGLQPIVIRITKNRKKSLISTGQYISEKDWDEVNQRVRKSHINAAWLNNFIAKKLAEVNDKLLELESRQEGLTAQYVRKQITNAKNASTFFELAEIYLEQLETQGQLNRLSVEKSRIKHFKEFLKYKDITFPEINEVLLRQFQGFLRSEKGNGERTTINCLVIIRTLFNLAIRESIVDSKFYPFGKGGITLKFPESVKIGLSLEEIEHLEKIELDSEKEIHARNVFLFSYYFAGIRVSDVLRLKWDDFRDERLYYKMGKNSKVLSLKIPEQAQQILDQYVPLKRSASDFVFPELKKADLTNVKDIQTKIKNGTKTINKYLKRVALKMKLDKPLTMHIARHTFGNISGDKIPVQILQLLYRHSDITTTMNYQASFAHKQADDALDKVLNSKRKL